VYLSERTPIPMPEMEPPAAERLLVVDRRPLVRSGLAQVAGRAFGTVSAAAAGNLDSAAAEIRFMGVAPRALLLGLDADEDPVAGVAAARQLARTVIGVLDSREPGLMRGALAAQADGYLMLEHASPARLREILRSVESGTRVFPAELDTWRAGMGASPALTARCREVMESLAAGLHDDEVAERLGITVRSVRKHIATAQERLEARTRIHALAIAAREGLI
jgi:two-component system NarL family response regulator